MPKTKMEKRLCTWQHKWVIKKLWNYCARMEAMTELFGMPIAVGVRDAIFMVGPVTNQVGAEA